MKSIRLHRPVYPATRLGWHHYYARQFCRNGSAHAEQLACWYLFLHLALDVSQEPEERYLVTWAIDLYADTPEEAAQQALVIQRDPASIATVFSVESLVRQAKAVIVELEPQVA